MEHEDAPHIGSVQRTRLDSVHALRRAMGSSTFYDRESLPECPVGSSVLHAASAVPSFIMIILQDLSDTAVFVISSTHLTHHSAICQASSLVISSLVISEMLQVAVNNFMPDPLGDTL